MLEKWSGVCLVLQVLIITTLVIGCPLFESWIHIPLDNIYKIIPSPACLFLAPLLGEVLHFRYPTGEHQPFFRQDFELPL